MHINPQHGDVFSVFEKFGGIRPMAACLGLPHSTVKAWHYARSIPKWRHDLLLRRAGECGISLTVGELTNVRADSQPLKRGRPNHFIANQTTERAA